VPVASTIGGPLVQEPIEWRLTIAEARFTFVKPGDTLTGITLTFYADPRLAANQLRNFQSTLGFGLGA
jgi:hypothetical protein